MKAGTEESPVLATSDDSTQSDGRVPAISRSENIDTNTHAFIFLYARYEREMELNLITQ